MNFMRGRKFTVYDEVFSIGRILVRFFSVTIEYTGDGRDATAVSASYFRHRLGKEIQVDDRILDKIDKCNEEKLSSLATENIQEEADYRRDLADMDYDFRHSKGVY